MSEDGLKIPHGGWKQRAGPTRTTRANIAKPFADSESQTLYLVGFSAPLKSAGGQSLGSLMTRLIGIVLEITPQSLVVGRRRKAEVDESPQPSEQRWTLEAMWGLRAVGDHHRR